MEVSRDGGGCDIGGVSHAEWTGQRGDEVQSLGIAGGHLVLTSATMSVMHTEIELCSSRAESSSESITKFGKVCALQIFAVKGVDQWPLASD